MQTGSYLQYCQVFFAYQSALHAHKPAITQKNLKMGWALPQAHCVSSVQKFCGRLCEERQCAQLLHSIFCALCITWSLHTVQLQHTPEELFFKMSQLHLDRISETSENFVNEPECNAVKANLQQLTCKTYQIIALTVSFRHSHKFLLVSEILFWWIRLILKKSSSLATP